MQENPMYLSTLLYTCQYNYVIVFAAIKIIIKYTLPMIGIIFQK